MMILRKLAAAAALLLIATATGGPTLMTRGVDSARGYGFAAHLAAGCVPVTITPTNLGTTSNTTGATLNLTTGAPSNTCSAISVEVYDFTGSAFGTVTDSASNSYTLVSNTPVGSSIGTYGALGVYVSTNAAALSSGGTITYTPVGSGFSIMMSAQTVAGAATSSLIDAAVTVTGTGTGTGTCQPFSTSGTPGSTGELFIGTVACENSNAFGFTFNQDTGNGWAVPPNSVSSSNSPHYVTILAGGSVVASSSPISYDPTATITGGAYAYASIIIGLKHN